MLVTVPLVLLLLDYWPLGRFGRVREAKPSIYGALRTGTNRGSPHNLKFGRLRATHHAAEGPVLHTPYMMLLLEKLPLVVLAAASAATYLVQRSVGAVTVTIEPAIRLQTIVVGYVRYLAMLVWLFSLAVSYPRERVANAPAIVLSSLALIAVSAVVLLTCRRARATCWWAGSGSWRCSRR